MNQIEYQETFEKTYLKVLNYLSYKPRSEHEISTYIDKVTSKWQLMESDGIQLREEILADLKTRKYVDDKAYVSEYLRGSLNSPKVKSIRAMKMFLYKKGIDNSLVEHALDSLNTSELEKDTIEKLANKKLRTLKELPPHELKSKLVKFLLQKGYLPNNVYTVVDSILGVK